METFVKKHLHLHEDTRVVARGIFETQGVCAPTLAVFGSTETIMDTLEVACDRGFEAKLKLVFINVRDGVAENKEELTAVRLLVRRIKARGFDVKTVYDLELSDLFIKSMSPIAPPVVAKPIMVMLPHVCVPPVDQKGNIFIPSLSVIHTRGKKWVTFRTSFPINPEANVFEFPRLVSTFGDVRNSLTLHTNEFEWTSFFENGMRIRVKHDAIFNVHTNAYSNLHYEDQFVIMDQQRQQRTTHNTPKKGDTLIVNSSFAYRFGLVCPHNVDNVILSVIDIEGYDVKFIDNVSGVTGIYRVSPNGMSVDCSYSHQARMAIFYSDKRLYQQHVSNSLMILSAVLEKEAMLTNWCGIVSTEYETIMPKCTLDASFDALFRDSTNFWLKYELYPRTPFSFHSKQQFVNNNCIYNDENNDESISSKS